MAVATHDGRFLTPLRQAIVDDGAIVRDDPWTGHRLHHEPLSREVAGWADVLIAEWCLGNAVWHAAHRAGRPRRPRSGPGRLLVRLHRFELETDFPAELDMEAVDAVVFVGPHVRDEAVERFGWPRERCVVLPNSVEAAAFDLPKADGAAFTLGLLTWHRRLKRLDLALDVLEGLRRDEPRFRLRVKGTRPEDVEHVWKYEDERAYFDEQYARIQGTPLLRDAVRFDPPGADVPDWFRHVGYVLSVSDVESFHLALAEGMASGAVPVILDRPGAVELFGDEWVVHDVDGAVRAVSAYVGEGRRAPAGAAARSRIATTYDHSVVLPAWRDLIRAAAAGGMTANG